MNSDDKLDQALREGVLADPVNSTDLERAVRERIGRDGLRCRWWIGWSAAAAAILLAVLLSPLLSVRSPYLGAAFLDHRREVLDHERRNWVTDQSSIDALAKRQGFRAPDVAKLVPAGYRFEHGKLCRLDADVFLHLVYSDGASEVSVFLRPLGKPTIASGRGSGLCASGFAGGLVVGDSMATASQISQVVQAAL